MSNDGNVVDFPRKRKKSNKDDRLRLIDIYKTLVAAVNRGPAAMLVPAFPRDFYLLAPVDGAKVIAEKVGGEFKVATTDTLVTAMYRYCHEECGDMPEWHLKATQVRESVDSWKLETRPIPMPKAVAWRGEAAETFRRLPWDFALDGTGEHTATWNKLLSRIHNVEAFMAWVGSLFFEESTTTQYVFMFGSGGDGKGAISRFLYKVFGNAYCAKHPPGRDDRFWTYELIGKRVVVFPDCNSKTFMISGLFKALTGGDPIPVEAKKEMAFTFVPSCRYLFLSNKKPKINTNEAADTRRIIYCEFEPGAVDYDPDFEDKLWKEGGYFISACVDRYRQDYPNHGPIRGDNERIIDRGEVLQGEFNAVFDENFKISYDPVDKAAWMPSRTIFNTVVHLFRGDERKADDFLTWLGQVHGLHSTAVRYDDKVEKRYKGLVQVFCSTERYEVTRPVRSREVQDV